jgi:hypothetical protein
MGLRLIESTPRTARKSHSSGRRVGGKLRPKVSDLPLPHGPHGLADWHETFVPTLLSWAGSHKDPFGTNSQMDDEIQSIWSHTYPGRVLGNEELATVRTVVRESIACFRCRFLISVQCESSVNTWRSEMGKVGRRALADFWCTDPSMMMSAEARAWYVAKSLEGFQFVYKDPDACVSANTV